MRIDIISLRQAALTGKFTACLMLLFFSYALNAAERHIIIDLTVPDQSFFLSQSSKQHCQQLTAQTWPGMREQESTVATVLKHCSDLRLLSNKGDKIIVTVFYASSGSTVSLNIAEKPRKTRLQSELKNILKFARQQFFGPPSQQYVHYQKYKRSSLQLKVHLDGSEKHEAKYLLGPKEHWFLSLDMLISEADRLKYDQTSASLVEKDIPSSFYLGINFMPFLDVLSESYSFKRAFLLKALFKVSDHPLDSAGLGIGYRLPELSLGKKTLGSTIIYAAYMLDKEDVLEGGIVKEGEKYAKNWRFGISFSVDKLGQWIK